MRAFIVLSFVVAATSAAGLGYNYGVGISGTIENSGSDNVYQTGGAKLIGGGNYYQGGAGKLIGGGLIGTSGGSLISNTYPSRSGGLIGGGGFIGGSKLIGGGGLNYQSGGGGLSYQSGGGINYQNGGGINYQNGQGINYQNGGGYFGGGGVSGGSRVVGHGSIDHVPQTIELSKQYFHFNAPEEYHEGGQTRQQVSNVLKKNLQVVFIRAPENNAATNAALQLAKQAIEQKTVIYVLTKQNDPSQLVGQIQQIQENVPTAPEVRFIKYRTPEDIAIAKQQIQSQYDSIGGTSQVIDGGVAPVLNYASGGSSLSGSGLSSGVSSGVGSSIISGGGSSYDSGIGSGLSSGIISGGGSKYGSGLVSGVSSGLGSGFVSKGGSSYSSSLGSGVESGSGGVNYSTGLVKPDYLPPNALKK